MRQLLALTIPRDNVIGTLIAGCGRIYGRPRPSQNLRLNSPATKMSKTTLGLRVNQPGHRRRA